jgi:preprotein translocase subunit SecD
MNKYPYWKYLTIIFILVLGLVYALPNMYGYDAAIQIANKEGDKFADDTLKMIENTLTDVGIDYKSVTRDRNGAIVRLKKRDDQEAAKDTLIPALGSDYFLASSDVAKTPGWLRAFGAKPMYLGLDLRGGLHFLIEVDLKTPLKQKFSDLQNELYDIFERTEEKKNKRIKPRDTILYDDHIELKYKTDQDREESLRVLRRQESLQNYEIKTFERDGFFFINIALSEVQFEKFKDTTVNQIITVFNRRIDEKYQGLVEPNIVPAQSKDAARIVAEFPGLQDSTEIVETITATARLEFRMNSDGGASDLFAKPYKTTDGETVYLNDDIIVTGNDIVNASSSFDKNSSRYYQVNVTLSNDAAWVMGETTRKNLGKKMAVVYINWVKEEVEKDGKKVEVPVKKEEVISNAVIQGRFSKNFRITGSMSQREASNLALYLRSGALTAPIQIVEERSIGPSLGAENINKGLESVIIGFVLVVAFILFWYKTFGLIANVALFINLILMVAVLSIFQATLTLPGIAGIVLTVGMAVDANVLIFERIREELRVGSTPQASIHAGYEKAFSTIADANITTFIAALVLFQFGSGPIKGFATTLSIGIATSMFTAIMVTRAIVNSTMGGRRLSKLSI